MTLTQLTLFAAVAKHLSLTKASLALRISQPAITYQLGQLEEHCGVKLYRRLSKGVEMTEQGRLLLRNITPILDQLASLEKGLIPTRKMPREVLSVGGTFSASALLLPRLLARFQQGHPTTDLEFQTATSEKLERMIGKGGMHVAVTDRRPSSRQLLCERLRSERVQAFVLPTHPLAGQDTVSIADISREPLIVRGGKGISGTTQSALRKLKAQGWVIRIAMLCDAPAGIKAAVRQGMGVGIAFADSIKLEIDAGEFKALKVDGFEVEADSFIVYAKNQPLSPIGREFLELLREERTDDLTQARSSRSKNSKASQCSTGPGSERGIPPPAMSDQAITLSPLLTASPSD